MVYFLLGKPMRFFLFPKESCTKGGKVMEELKKTIASNIVDLRRGANMTQAELAEKLCYSDKAISKWERGESIPDVFILKQVADLFGVTVDFLLTDNKEEKAATLKAAKKRSRTHLLISLISTSLVWLIATALYVGFKLSNIALPSLWLAFIFAIPVSSIVLLIFNSIWGKPKLNYIIISVLMWTTLLSICLALFHFHIWLLLAVGAPGQVIIILWSGLNTKRITRKNKKTEHKKK